MKEIKTNPFRTILTVFLITVAVLCAYQIFISYQMYEGGKDEYEEVQKTALPKAELPEDTSTDPGIDWDALYQQNSDIVGWLYFPNSDTINYPIVQGADNDYYLNHTFEGNESYIGSIFVDYNNRNTFEDQNTIVYGHHLKNGMMFAGLMNYQDKAYFQENPYFYIYTPNGKTHQFKIFSAHVTDGGSDVYTYSFGDIEKYKEWLAAMKSLSNYDTGVTPTETNRVVTLSTCTGYSNTSRMVVQGVEVN